MCDVFVIDDADRDKAPEIEALGMRAVAADTIMNSDADKERLANYICGLTR